MPQTKSNPKPRAGCGSKILTTLAVVLIVGIGLYFMQRLIRPGVDPDRTKPVVVTEGDGMVMADSEIAHLPAGAITATITQKIIDDAQHPFDPLLKLAEASVLSIDQNIRDYRATLVSQVFVDGQLQPEKYLHCKIRHQHLVDGKQVPFSVYTLFLKPEANVGQEAIWVAGQNNGDLIAHATGFLNVKRFVLNPDGPIAMQGNRYPIRNIGMRNLIVKMAEIGEKDQAYGECNVTIKRKVEVNGCQCTMLEAIHPVKRDHFEYHIARIFIDDARNIPIAYEGYLWPEKAGDKPPLLEKYYYTDIELNVGLTDEDFDPANAEYNYPAW